MATLPEGLSQKDIDRYAKLDKGIKALQEEHAILNELIKQTHKAAGIVGNKTLVYKSAEHGSVIVKLGQQKRLDAETAAATFPEDEFPEYYTSTFDPKKMPADISAAFRTNIVQTLSVSVGD
jgi:hypothetical protein